MTTDDLVRKLQEMRHESRRGENMTAMMHVFGILFDDEIERIGVPAAEIARRAGLPEVEGQISDGRKLAQYVNAQKWARDRWRP